MLKYLHIENIAVIESADIEPLSGFNVLTGETGAGKSIVIDSINAVLGERTSKELIRNGSDKAMVSAVFSNLSSSCLEHLQKNGIFPDEDGNISVQRVLSTSGNGSVRICGQLVTAQNLREISRYLINIHGQHDNQMLLKPENHYIYLDLIASNQKHKENYTSAFKKFTDIRRTIKELETDDDLKADRIDLLRYQINELENADIHIGEFDELKHKRELIQNGEKLISLLNNCVYMLNGDGNSDGATAMARAALNFLEKALDEQLSNTANELASAVSFLENTADCVRKYINDFAYSKEELEKINERLDLLNRLMLKYGNSETAALDYLNNARKELEIIQLSDVRLSELENELILAEEKLIDAGEKLTQSRKEAAREFEKGVCDSLSFMDMANVRFVVDIKEAKYSKNGKDSIEFLISTNAGETIKPLSKVASGGELSRIMLAIKSIIADKDDVDTLIFDEIDTGISGRAASKVAIQLKKVSKIRQVVCVTHLAQIAAAAEGHFLIEKSVKDNKTYTNVNLLDYNKRVDEIARIMSGTELSVNIISSARELLDRSRN